MSKFDGNNEERSRRPGRPVGSGHRGENYHGKCDVRLDKNEMRMLEDLAELNEVTKSDVMRKALRDYYRWNINEKEE